MWSTLTLHLLLVLLLVVSRFLLLHHVRHFFLLLAPGRGITIIHQGQQAVKHGCRYIIHLSSAPRKVQFELSDEARNVGREHNKSPIHRFNPCPTLSSDDPPCLHAMHTRTMACYFDLLRCLSCLWPMAHTGFRKYPQTETCLVSQMHQLQIGKAKRHPSMQKNAPEGNWNYHI